MKTTLRRVFGLVVVCLAAGVVAVGTSLADGPGRGKSADAHQNGPAPEAVQNQTEGAPTMPDPGAATAPSRGKSEDSHGSGPGGPSPSGNAGGGQSNDHGGPAAPSGNGPGDHGRGNSIDAHFANITRQAQTLQSDGTLAATGSLTAAADCGFGPSVQLFLPWGDTATYNLAPQGDLASSDGWSLNDASVVAAHDPYSGSAGSVELTSGNSSATSPVTCISLYNPTIRFFVLHAGPQSRSTLDVYVNYQDTRGRTHRLTVATLNASDTWQPSPVIPIGVNVLAPVSVNGWTPVSFGFTTEGLRRGESYSIDGLYVDPFRSR